jgi:hypothetical protein
MSYWRKLLIVVLLILSLPVQSYAAVLMKCAAEPADAGHSVTSHLDLDLGVAEHHHEMRQIASVGGEHHHDGSRHPHACSSCVSCCVGAGLPSASAVAVPAGDLLVAIRIPSSAGVVSFLTGGIERPPRKLLV